MIGIYKITNPLGQIYIGQSVNIEERLRGHKSQTRVTAGKIFLSIKEHGFNNHIFEVLEICDKELLNEKERYWQDFYNSYSEIHLNTMATKANINSKGFHSIKTREKISKSMIRTDIRNNKVIQSNSIQYTNPVFDDLTGVFYRNPREASMYNSVRYETLLGYLKLRSLNMKPNLRLK